MKEKISTTQDHLKALARLVRSHILRSTTAAGSGHPTSSLSAVELMVGLMFGGAFRSDLNRPHNPNNDRLIFSKGHAAPLLYALYAAVGRIKPSELLRLRKFGSRLEGHPMPRFPYTEFPTGSLGQGLSVGVGMALAAKLDRLPYRTYVLLGDSEMAEGSIWEAIQFASFNRLDNLTAILDVNKLGQSGPTMLGHDLRAYERRVGGFGWRTIAIDGHDLSQVLGAYASASNTRNKPTMIVAKTLKGKGVSFLENKEGWHGKALNTEELKTALTELGPINTKLHAVIELPEKRRPTLALRKPAKELRYKMNDAIATRKAFGQALVRLAPAFPNLMVLDGEVKNSTFTELLAERFPKKFIQSYIAEQNLVGTALGLATRGKLPVVSTFAAFFTRAFDQLRMAQYSQQHLVFVGTHVGVSIGEDGASQMGLEDIAMFRTLQDSVVLYPSDAISMERLVERALKARGIVYVRATRGVTPVIYKPTTRFTIGGSTILRKSNHDRATIIAAGITLHQALKAAQELAKRKINVRVIDLYSIKPIDSNTLRQAARETKHLITVEDHHPAGGMAEAVRSALGPLAGTVISLAVTKIPRSGKSEEQLRFQGIDSQAIVRVVKKFR
ncbi:MAG: transketolase [Candidatus Kerfeldbacteria bacterium]|nr:transketolase [Candidatus Kerfeldbacteria bacterium]